MPAKPNDMWVAQEVFTILRELTASEGYLFRWKKALQVYDAVHGYQPHCKDWGKASGGKKYLHFTLGNMLRAQLSGGTIRRVTTGLYAFKDVTRIAKPLYVKSSLYLTGPYACGKSDMPAAVLKKAAAWHTKNPGGKKFSPIGAAP